MTRVVIVDDRPSIRRGLSALFGVEPDLEVCGLADSGEGGLALALTLLPDVVVMDLSMPGIGGMAATRAIVESGCSSRVLVLSWMWSEGRMSEAAGAGARGYVVKSEGPERLLVALRAVAAGELYYGRPLDL